MANIDIYPFGTGGTIPSSIGIINDCTTGGSDKALSAEQGKILGNIVFPLDLVMPKEQSSPAGRQDVPLVNITFQNKVPGGQANAKRALSNTISIPSQGLGLHMTLASGYLGQIYFLRSNGTWDSEVDSSGAFSDSCYCAVPTDYFSGGVWLYIEKTGGDTNISVSEAKNSITALYWDVPNEYYLPVASKEEATREISILFIGNSLTQDAVSYVPFLLKNLYPKLSFRFYMWYNGGYTLSQQYNDFINNGKADIFSVCENNIGWTNYSNSVTMSYVLSNYRFDIVCIQEYFNYKTTYNDCTDFNNCVNYIKSNYSGNFKVVNLFHAPKRDTAESIFNMTKFGNELILKTTISESMISPGVAVYRALSTDLDSLGDQGHLSPDGTHTQEGLPCLLQAFVVYKWIMRQLAIPVSVANCSLRMTSAIYSTINVPGPNLGTGVIQGTDAQNILAQDVAILADKEGIGYENEALSGIGT